MNKRLMVRVLKTALHLLSEAEVEIAHGTRSSTSGICTHITNAAWVHGLDLIKGHEMKMEVRDLFKGFRPSSVYWFGNPTLKNIEKRYTALLLAIEYYGG